MATYKYKIKVLKGTTKVLKFNTNYRPKIGCGKNNGKLENKIVLEQLIKNNIVDGNYEVSFTSKYSNYQRIRRIYKINLTTTRRDKVLKYELTYSGRGNASILNDEGTVKEPIIRSSAPLISLPPAPLISSLPTIPPPPPMIPLFPINIPDPTIYDIDTHRIT